MERRLSVLSVVGLALTALIVSSISAAAADIVDGGPKVGQWRTYVLTSGAEIPVPAPPAEDSDQTKAELEELRRLQQARTDVTNTAIQWWNSAAAPQRWIDQTLALNAQERLNGPRQGRSLGIVTTAIHDAVVATWHAKYTHNRRPPGQVPNDLRSAVVVTGESAPAEPSYPSEHAAVAAAAAGVLTYLFPNEEQALATLAREAGETRLMAGLNYRSDVEAGMALGQAVAQKAIARARADGSDAVYAGTPPTGPGIWTGTTLVEPLAATWKGWHLTSGSQLRPAPPPAFGSAEFQAALDEVKRYATNPTPSQRSIAVSWATRGLGAVFETMTHLIARDRLNAPRAARVLAAVGTAWMVVSIATWDGKFHYWLLRPNQADPTITTLVPTPPYPAYPAGLPAAVGATTEVLAYFFPQDAARLRHMADEAGLSRVYTGIHYRFDSEEGVRQGRAVAGLAAQRDQQNDG